MNTLNVLEALLRGPRLWGGLHTQQKGYGEEIIGSPGGRNLTPGRGWLRASVEEGDCWFSSAKQR